MARAAVRHAVALCSLLALAGCMSRPLPPPPAPTPVALPAAPAFSQVGEASWYGSFHHGRKTASGEIFDMNDLTAAHRTLPLGTEARVTNLENGKSVTVTVNDRGPYKNGRIIDLSRRAAQALGIKEQGVATVRVEVAPAGEAIETATIGN
jgi:rare lipoprotein A